MKCLTVRPSLPGTSPETTLRPMLPGAGEADSCRRWASLPMVLVFLASVPLFCVFTEVSVLGSLIFGRRRFLRSLRQRRALWFSFVVFPVTPSLQLVSVLAMFREDSLTTALFRFTASLYADYVQAYQLLKELSHQPTNPLFPSPGSPEPVTPQWFSPLHSYGTRSIRFTRANPSFIGIISFSSPLKVKPFSPVWIRSGDCSFHLKQNLSGVLPSGTDVQGRSRAGAPLPTPKVWNVRPAQFIWAWPIWVTKLSSPYLIALKPKAIQGMIRPLLGFSWRFSLSEISGGFTRISYRCVLSYFSCGIILPMGSSGLVSISPSFSSKKCLLSPSFLSMKGFVVLGALPSISFSFLTGLPSCGAVYTGPEDAIEITHVFLVGENWLSTSPPCVTISQLPDFVVKALSTKSSLVSISLSSSFEELSIVVYFAKVPYDCNLRGWLIPSVFCNRTI